ncbi:MAG: class I SAM-dependent methyltransferase, partial [Planctomycetales bacterium]|nr:class I SAM-dependent methyltransferase [Planctomycetales bacterium]
MDDPDKVAAYNRAGREDGVMAPVYLYHAAQVSEVVKPGDSVIDLGCGPATQLGMVARFNPEVSFTGVDLSEEMLSRARDNVAEKQLGNVRFEHCDITSLDFLADNSVDAVMSTVVLHHLPDVQALEKVFAEVKRVLKPGGGLYLVDFGHLKSEKSIEYFAYQYADRQAELFTCDYLYSLRAAFQKDDFRWL